MNNLNQNNIDSEEDFIRLFDDLNFAEAMSVLTGVDQSTITESLDKMARGEI